MNEAITREWFVEGLLSEIAPRNHAEALRVLDYAEYAEGVDEVRLMAIARNLVGSGFKSVSETDISSEDLPIVVIAPEWPFHHDYTNPDVAGAAVLDCMTAFQKSMRAQGFEVEVKK